MNTEEAKLQVAKTILKYSSAYVHICARDEEVYIPPWLKNQDQVVLQIGFNMPIAIDDLALSEEGFIGTLSFSRKPYTCTVPWKSVFAIIDDNNRGMVWNESMPEAIRLQIVDEQDNVEKLDFRAARTPKFVNRRPKATRTLPSYIRVIK